jgi:acetyl-CoA acetyltransferase
VDPLRLRQTAIAGVGATEFSKNSGRSELQLALECSRAAIADAGLQPREIDGFVTFTVDNNAETALAPGLGVKELRWASRMPYGGAGSVAAVLQAATAVASGAARAVLVWRAFNERSERRYGQPTTADRVRTTDSVDASWYTPFGLDTPAKWAGLQFQRYMASVGLTNSDLGHYSVACRDWASTNPAAWFYGRPITHDDHQNSRWIAEPVLRLLDCCQESDGGVGLVVTSAERAADGPSGGARLAAGALRTTTDFNPIVGFYGDDLAGMPAARAVGQALWAGELRPHDMDAAMLYDAFSPAVFLHLEELGLCPRGELREFVTSGQLGRGGRLPVNTHGGLLGEAYIHGMNNIAEGVRQVRSQSVNQLPDARNVIVASGIAAMVLQRIG